MLSLPGSAWTHVRAFALSGLLLVIGFIGCPPGLKAQDMEAAQELVDLTQKMQSADDPCPYLPQVRALMNRIANSSPEVYETLKPQLDQINGMDLNCNDSSKDGQPAPENAGQDQNPAKNQANSPVSVRYAPGETRMLTDEEYGELRSGLHYRPETAPVSPGGSAQSVLVDGRGTPLVTVTVTWIRTERNGSLWTGRFRVTMANSSGCLFTSHASLLIPGSAIDAEGVNFGTWTTWVTLHEPLPGRTDVADGIATLGNDYTALIFKPVEPEYSLTQCRTPVTVPQSSTFPRPWLVPARSQDRPLLPQQEADNVLPVRKITPRL